MATQSRLKRIDRLEQRLLEIRNQEIAAYEKLLVNPYLKENQRLLGHRILLLAHRKRPDPDGMVHLSAAEISGDYRKKPEPGDSWAGENPDGSLPLAQRNSTKNIVSSLVDDGAIDVAIDVCHRVSENGSLYRDSDFIIAPIGIDDLANRINQLADYRRDKSRTPYGAGAA